MTRNMGLSRSAHVKNLSLLFVTEQRGKLASESKQLWRWSQEVCGWQLSRLLLTCGHNKDWGTTVHLMATMWWREERKSLALGCSGKGWDSGVLEGEDSAIKDGETKGRGLWGEGGSLSGAVACHGEETGHTKEEHLCTRSAVWHGAREPETTPVWESEQGQASGLRARRPERKGSTRYRWVIRIFYDQTNGNVSHHLNLTFYFSFHHLFLLLYFMAYLLFLVLFQLFFLVFICDKSFGNHIIQNPSFLWRRHSCLVSPWGIMNAFQGFLHYLSDRCLNKWRIEVNAEITSSTNPQSFGLYMK